MIKKLTRNKLRKKRTKRIRKKIKGTANVPRLCVYKSLKNLYCQIIDDQQGKTLLSLSSSHLNLEQENSHLVSRKNKKIAELLGRSVAEKASKRGISKVVFDKSGYLYHGKIKCFADSARKGGLQF